MSKHFGTPNESETNSNLDISKCVTSAPSPSGSAIDVFEVRQKDFVKRAALTRDVPDPEQIRLLLLGLVSSCENYFRQLLTELLSACPMCRETCSQVTIKFATATYFSGSNIAQALTDDSVFSSAENIVTETRRLTGINANDFGSVKGALAEFHKVCVIRHATVHSLGDLGGKNAVDLKLSTTQRQMVVLNIDSFQEIADVCVNLVRAYNGNLWKAIVARLNHKEILKFDETQGDEDLFKSIQKVLWNATLISTGTNGDILYKTLCAGKSALGGEGAGAI